MLLNDGQPAGGPPPSSAPSSPAGGSGSTTPSPSLGGSTSDSTTVTSGGGEGGSDFNFMDSIFGEPSQPQSAAGSPEGTAPQTPAQPAVAQPAGTLGTQTPAATEQAPAAPAAQTQPAGPQGTLPAFDPGDPLALARGLEQLEPEARAELSKQFAMTPEEVEAFVQEPGKHLPQMFAKLAFFIQKQFLSQMGRIVPAMIQKQGAQTSAQEKGLSQFYEKWKAHGLDREKHGQAVDELGRRYRQMFPQKTTEQLISELGPMVLMHLGLGLQPTAAPAKGPNGTTQVPKPFTPGTPTPVATAQVNTDGEFDYMSLG